MKITVFGSYNGTSIGDTAILLGLLRAIGLAKPTAEITVLSMGPIKLSKDQALTGLSEKTQLIRANAWKFQELPVLRSIFWRVEQWLPYGRLLDPINVERCKAILKQQDLLIIGGGNLLMDLFEGNVKILEIICETAEKTGVPYCFVGVGAGPIDSSDARLVLRGCLARAHAVVVRDETSRRLCHELLGRKDTTVAPDFAFALQGTVPSNTVRGALALNVAAVGDKTWPWRKEDFYQSYIEGITKLTLSAIDIFRPNRIDIVSTNMTVDRRAVEDVLTLLNRGDKAVGCPAISASCDDVSDVLSSFSNADLAITTRLHAGILASLAGCRVLPVVYDHKVRAVLTQEQIVTDAIDIADLTNSNKDATELLLNWKPGPFGLPRDISSELVNTLRDVFAKV